MGFCLLNVLRSSILRALPWVVSRAERERIPQQHKAGIPHVQVDSEILLEVHKRN